MLPSNELDALLLGGGAQLIIQSLAGEGMSWSLPLLDAGIVGLTDRTVASTVSNSLASAV